MTRRAIIVLAALGCAVAGLVPVVLAVWLAWQEALEVAQGRLERQAQALADNTAYVLGQVAAGLKGLDRLPLVCNDEVIRRLREVAFDVAEITETGLMTDDGHLFCTSWGQVEPPIAFELEEVTGEIGLKGPVEAQVMGRYILVAERPRPAGGWSNALVQPRTMVGVAAAQLEETGFVGLFSGTDPRPYVSLGPVPELALEPTAAGLPSLKFNDEVRRLTAQHPVPGFPKLFTMASASVAGILGPWWRTTALTVGLGVAVAAALILGVLALTRRRLSLRGELRQAVAGKGLKVRYQPVIDLATGECVGAEALLRWHHAEHGDIRPDLFVPLAESTGMINSVTRFMLEQVVEDLEGLLAADPRLHVAVNIWPEHVRSGWILPVLDQTVGASRLKYSQVVLELTERTLMSPDDSRTREVLAQLHRRGCAIAIDDFGTGYSSLAYLKAFELDYLKIDRQFVGAIGSDAITANLVDAIVDIAHHLQLKLIAEGVENAEQAAYLNRLGVEWVQGFHYARAMKIRALREFIDDRAGTAASRREVAKLP